MTTYNHKEIEKKWAEKWSESHLYETRDNQEKPKYYVLDMFPYPSGAGLHVGHPKGYIATDVLARMRMLQGFNVLHPMGWDAFGLPAENYALKNKVHPRVATEQNINTFKKQLLKLGLTYDWSREVNTTDPEFYKWTQWTFLKMFEKGLAYESYEPINWCPECQTGLANEDLEDGKCERCGSEIEKKPMRQWVLKITDYADRLLNDLNKLPYWEEPIKEMQKNWIGKSEGAEIEFRIFNFEFRIKVFTTRPDTIFGATYIVLAPEHKLIQDLKSEIKNWDQVEEYVAAAKKKSEMERTDLTKEKTGVKLEGITAINPANGELIPVYTADYVLSGYGTGAIMAVPGHDERDFEFATRHNLPIKAVVSPDLGEIKDDAETEEMWKLLKQVDEELSKEDIKVWFNGTFGVIGHYGKIFKKPADLDCGVMEKDFEKAKAVLDKIGFRKIKDKDHENFRVTTYEKNNVTVEIGTFNMDLGNDVATIKDISFRVPNREWLAECYRITSKKDRRKGENDLDRAVFLEIASGSWTESYTKDGISINSGFLSGLKTADAKEKMIEWLEQNKLGKRKVNYKLKDWVFSRQRYWGEPIPIIHCEKCGAVPVPENELPVKLPEVENYEPTGTGESPLANISEWVNTVCPKCGGAGKRETNTMPQWAGSSWYYLRYIDPHNDKVLVDKEKEKYWDPVDFYVGGAEHATRHLIYARFWHKFLFDIGAVNYEEPFTRFTHVGLILAEDGRKMSKRWGNVINPDEIVEKYGADSLRVYEMFMGPFVQSALWSTNGLMGARKFLDRVWSLQEKELIPCGGEDTYKGTPEGMPRLLHQTIKKVSEDIEDFHFNTAISQMMIFVNFALKFDSIPKTALEKFIIILSPFAPHFCEELWENLGHKESIFKEKWPKYDPELAKNDVIDLVIQVNGRLRDTIQVDAEISEEDAKSVALENDKIKKWIEGKEVKKVIFVKGKLVNIVLG